MIAVAAGSCGGEIWIEGGRWDGRDAFVAKSWVVDVREEDVGEVYGERGWYFLAKSCTCVARKGYFGGGVGAIGVMERDGPLQRVLLALSSLVEQCGDSWASRLSVKRLPLLLRCGLANENVSWLSIEVCSSVGGRRKACAVRLARRVKITMQAWNMEGQKRRMKISMPINCAIMLVHMLSQCGLMFDSQKQRSSS